MSLSGDHGRVKRRGPAQSERRSRLDQRLASIFPDRIGRLPARCRCAPAQNLLDGKAAKLGY